VNNDDFVEVVSPRDFATADRLFEEWLASREIDRAKSADDIRVDFVRDTEGRATKRYRVRRHLLDPTRDSHG
jgi:hypothetical protein